MTLLTDFRKGTSELHGIAEGKMFVARYHHRTVKLIDHYRHLSQLLPIYEALEKKLKSPHFQPKLPNELQYLLNRSSEIKKDLLFLKSKSCIAKTEKNDEILKSTRQYITDIENLKVGEDNLKILAHFLTRILGDLFGGQKIKEQITNLYQKEQIYHSNQPILGVNFYSFPENDTLKTLLNWLGQEIIPENLTELITHANHSFSEHIKIFDELEETRPTFLLTQNSSSFFTRKNLTLLGGAIAVTGAVIMANNYLNEWRKNMP